VVVFSHIDIDPDISTERADTSGTALARPSSNSKLQTRPLVRENYKITNPQLSKENFKKKEKLVAGPRWAPEGKHPLHFYSSIALKA
jgi:hypothetical protein